MFYFDNLSICPPLHSNYNHLKTTKALCDLLVNTALSKCVIGTNNCSAVKDIKTQSQDEITSIDDKEHEIKDNENEVKENESRKESKSRITNSKYKHEASSSTHNDKSKTLQSQTAKKEILECKFTGNENDILSASAEYTNSFHSVIDSGKSLDSLDESFMAVFNASDDINHLYAEKFRTYIVGYVEQWEKIISTRYELEVGVLMSCRRSS